MAQLPSPPVTDGLLIRPEREADYAVIADVVRAAFAGHPDEVVSLVERIRASEGFVPELALVAEDSSGVIAHVMLSWVAVEGGSRPEILNLTPMAVRPDGQRRGVGSRLIRDALGRAEAAGEPAVMVEGIPGYYPRFGFEPAIPLASSPPIRRSLTRRSWSNGSWDTPRSRRPDRVPGRVRRARRQGRTHQLRGRSATASRCASNGRIRPRVSLLEHALAVGSAGMTSKRARIGITAGVGLAAAGVASLVHRHRTGYAERGYELNGELDVCSPEFVRALEALTGAPVSEGNDLRVLFNGDEIFPVLLETIAAAERTLNLLTFVYWRGEIAVQVADAVCERARAGVRCNVLLDAFGAARMDERLVQTMQDAGVRVELFRPLKPYTLTKADHRTHRKVVVADGEVGMVGGVGIASEWTGNAQDPDHWRDTHVRVVGPVVRALQGAFLENWLEATGGSSPATTISPTSTRSPTERRCRWSCPGQASTTRTPRRCTSSRSRRPVTRSS